MTEKTVNQSVISAFGMKLTSRCAKLPIEEGLTMFTVELHQSEDSSRRSHVLATFASRCSVATEMFSE